MDYIEIIFRSGKSADYLFDLLPHFLEEAGFDGFCETDAGLSAYVPVSRYNRFEINRLLALCGLPADSFTEKRIPDKNWNEVWESKPRRPATSSRRSA